MLSFFRPKLHIYPQLPNSHGSFGFKPFFSLRNSLIFCHFVLLLSMNSGRSSCWHSFAFDQNNKVLVWKWIQLMKYSFINLYIVSASIVVELQNLFRKIFLHIHFFHQKFQTASYIAPERFSESFSIWILFPPRHNVQQAGKRININLVLESTGVLLCQVKH